MSNYTISDECRYYLDAIVHTFKYNRIADIRGSIKEVVIAEKGDNSKSNILRLYLLIINYLEHNKFGHSVDYVFIINKKGEDLKNCGSLKAYEEKENLKSGDSQELNQ